MARQQKKREKPVISKYQQKQKNKATIAHAPAPVPVPVPVPVPAKNNYPANTRPTNNEQSRGYRRRLQKANEGINKALTAFNTASGATVDPQKVTSIKWLAEQYAKGDIPIAQTEGEDYLLTKLGQAFYNQAGPANYNGYVCYRHAFYSAVFLSGGNNPITDTIVKMHERYTPEQS